MVEHRVIVDTNVLFAGLYSSTGASYQILRLVDSGVIRPVLSVPLLFEYEDVLRRNCAELQLSDMQVDVILDNLCALSDFQRVHFLWRPFLRDPKDDYVLEVAVASRSTRIITHNLRDFTGSEEFGIEAIPPRQFLEQLK